VFRGGAKQQLERHQLLVAPEYGLSRQKKFFGRHGRDCRCIRVHRKNS
jgi:hypothetical protein